MIYSNSLEYKGMIEKLLINAITTNEDMKEIYDEYAKLTLQIGKIDSIEIIIGKLNRINKDYSID